MNSCADTTQTEPQPTVGIPASAQEFDDLTHRLRFHRDNLGLAVIEWDAALRVTFWSASAQRMFGWTPSEVMGKYPTEWTFIFEADTNDVEAVIERLLSLREENNVIQNRNYTREGKTLVCEWHNSVLKDEAGKLVCVQSVVQDVTERNELELELRQKLALIEEQKTQLEATNAQLAQANALLHALATTDGLTGLNNHRAFQEQLTMEFQRSRRYQSSVAILMIDVDNFKQYNDRYGHPAGDQILGRVAALLQQTARTTDFVARYGGEEFVMLLPETDREGAMELAERVRAKVAAQEWGRFPITVSVGITSRQSGKSGSSETLVVGVSDWQAETLTPSVLVSEADIALYAAKAAGRNCIRHFAALPPPPEK